MSERRTRSSDPRQEDLRFGATFWDGVECEIEALDVNDFEDFVRSDRLPIEPDPGFREQLGSYLRGLLRARFSH